MPYKDKLKQRAAQARYNREHRAKIRVSVNVKVGLFRRRTQEIKASTPCADCGEMFPYYIMDFDHRPDEEKIRNISDVRSFGTLGELEKEIAKCDVVCANCHRHRTFMRATENQIIPTDQIITPLNSHMESANTDCSSSSSSSKEILEGEGCTGASARLENGKPREGSRSIRTPSA